MPRRLLALLVALVVPLAVLVPAVEAQQPPRLDRRVVDLTGTLGGGDIARIEAALREVEDDDGVQVFALFVRTTGSTPAPQFAEQTAETNGLGGNDAVILVVLDDRRHGYWLGDGLDDISDDEVEEVFTERIEPRLRASAWADAFIDGARGLGEAQSGTLGGAGEPAGGGGGVSVPWGPILAVGVVVIGGFLVLRALSGRRQRPAGEAGAPAEPPRDIEDLAREANTLLVETDEDVRQNEEELAFAEAQFGAAETEPFRKVLVDARASLREAFTLRQRLDDREPEPEPQRRQMLEEIVARCRQAETLMAEQREHFRELRNLERDAPQLLDALPASIDAVERRIPEAESQLDSVEADAPASARAVAGNIVEARKRVSTARELVDAGRNALASDRGAAARSVRAAQQAVAQATALLDAIAQLAAQAIEARDQAGALRAEVASDLATANQILEQHPDPALVQRLNAAEAAIETPVSDRDVVAEYRRLQQADSEANALVAAATEGLERRRREETALRHALRSAEQRVDRAAAFIESRRSGVGRVPRTRLHEAERELDRAHEYAELDTAAALQAANRASELAELAYELARDEFGEHDRRAGGVWGDPGAMMTGMILGQIFGGGRRGGGFGGGFGGGGFGGGGGGGRSGGGAW
jgi:hypothetical protein